jgi:hypothetical protein
VAVGVTGALAVVEVEAGPGCAVLTETGAGALAAGAAGWACDVAGAWLAAPGLAGAAIPPGRVLGRWTVTAVTELTGPRTAAALGLLATPAVATTTCLTGALTTCTAGRAAARGAAAAWTTCARGVG